MWLTPAFNGCGIYYNPSDNPAVFTGPTDYSVWGPHQIALAPGYNGEFSILRFTAQALACLMSRLIGPALTNITERAPTFTSSRTVFLWFNDLIVGKRILLLQCQPSARHRR